MNFSVNAPIESPNVIMQRVWYTGTDAVKQGAPLCRAIDFSGNPAAEYDGRRHNYVAKPTADNKSAFAGVAARDYRACKDGLQQIDIYCPGSLGVMVNVGNATTLNVTGLAFDVTSGTFKTIATAKGRGAAIARQTVAYSAAASKNLCQADLLTGDESGGQTVA